MADGKLYGNGKKVEFETKLEQAVNRINDIAEAFHQTRIIAVTGSWFGNNGLWKPLQKQLGQRFRMISRLRSNNKFKLIRITEQFLCHYMEKFRFAKWLYKKLC